MARTPNPFTSRFKFWAPAIQNRGIFLMGVIYAIAQAWDGISAQVVERWWDNPPRVIDAAIWAAQPPWYMWTILGLVVLIAIVMEGTYRVAGQDWTGNLDLADELRAKRLDEFFMKHIRDLNKGLELESGDRRKDELADLRVLGLVEMERIAAIPSQIAGNFEHGGAPPYNRYTTTELGNRLARFLETQADRVSA